VKRRQLARDNPLARNEELRAQVVNARDRLPIGAEACSDLLARARAAADHAYVPYSQFPVGAAALTTDGSIYTGCNIENASYGLTICAERTAASAAISAGHRQIVVIAVSAPKVSRTTPCGACRQFLNEFRPGDADMLIVLDDRNSGESVWLEDLLPRSFGAQNLQTAESVADITSLPSRADHGS
jgi:cytidine deaminase